MAIYLLLIQSERTLSSISLARLHRTNVVLRKAAQYIPLLTKFQFASSRILADSVDVAVAWGRWWRPKTRKCRGTSAA
jgi:hypothetical protein